MKKLTTNLIQKIFSFVLLLSIAMYADARDIYGFMTGNANPTDIPIGMYKFDSKTLEQTQITGIMATFWGGAYAEDNYYFLFSSDNQGYIYEGLHSFDFKSGKMTQVVPYVPYQCSDMTYDHSQGVMYGVQIQNGGEPVPHQLIQIDLVYGNTTKVAELTSKIAAIACNYWGDMYAMGYDGNLYLVDKTNGSLTFVASTGVFTNTEEGQSMDFDRETGELYWTYLDTNDDTHFTVLDVYAENVVKEDRLMPNNALIVGLYAEAPAIDDNAPAAPAALKISGSEGNVKLSWTNPGVNNVGGALSSISKIEVYRNNKLVYTDENAQPGAVMSWTDTDKADKCVAATRYVIYAYNENGRGEGASEQIFLGEDIPGEVTNFVVTTQGNDAVLTWEAPETGKQGGYINPDELVYKVTRKPGNVVFENIKGNTFTDNTVTTTAYYSYEIECGNAKGYGNAVTSETMVVGNPVEAPYSTDFSSEVLAAQWKVNDANADGITWTWKDNSFVYPYSFSNDADDHVVSVPFHLVKGAQYKVRYTISAPSLFSSPEHFRISVGDRIIEDLDAFNNNAPEERAIDFTVEEDGSYEFTMSSFSPKDNWQIVISNFAVDMIVDYDLALTAITGEEAVVAGKPVVYTVRLENRGLKDITKGEVKLTDDMGNLLTTQALGDVIAAGASLELPIEWVPVADMKRVIATAYVENDIVTSNNECSKDVYVINEDEFFVETESDGSHPNLMPFAFDGVSFTFAQTIYRHEDLNIDEGIISGISYRYTNNDKTVADRHIKLYVANSETDNILDGWLGSEEMTLVFDGYVDFKNGSNTLHIPFDAPFEYNGQNLRVTTEKLNDQTVADIRFNAKNFGTEARTAIYSGENYMVDINKVQGSSMLNEIILRVKNVKTGIDGAETVNAVSLLNGVLMLDVDADVIEIFDLSGLLLDRVYNSNMMNIDNLARGAYIVKVRCGVETMVKKILVK